MRQPSNRGWERPSIYDVARRAGVSHQTVSRVLNDRPNIRESTRSRVMQAVEEMNYTPNMVARALTKRRARRIGVVIDGVVQHGSDRTLRALDDAARALGYTVGAFSISDENSSQTEPGVMEVVAQGVDALCVLAPRASLLDLLRHQTTVLPTVVIGAEANPAWHTVGVDQRKVARLAVQHLVGLGHRRIAHLAGPADSFDARERAEGWRNQLAESGLEEGPFFFGGWNSDVGFEFGRSFDLGETTAVFAANDNVALGVIHGLHDRGIRVPEDVSVVGCDGLSDARHYLPPLTTVQLDFRELAELALHHIVAAIEGEAQPGRNTVQSRLIVRESTAVARAARTLIDVTPRA